MGIFRIGEKRYKDVGYTKELKVSVIGWKRILKNVECFGWDYVNDEDDGTIPPPPKAGKFKVSLLFLRIDDLKNALPRATLVLEFFYNIVFLLRKLAAFLLPIFFAVGIVISFIKRQDGMQTASAFFFTDFAVWLAGIILECVLARCSAAKIKKCLNSGGPQTTRKTKKPNKEKYPEPLSDDDDLITLKSANGEDIDFVELAGIKYGGQFYAILQPVELLEGMEDDEALVFKVSRNAKGEDNFEVELDDKIIDAVFVEYNKLLDEAEGKR